MADSTEVSNRPVVPLPNSFQRTPAELAKLKDMTIRNGWVKVMKARLVREELRECYYREGVNHYEKCGDLARYYMKLIREDRKVGPIVVDFN
ncbi:NADH-ubiquinone oxidoreductase subunit, mitochondrial [Neolecta irregularis DAH-3]|uniref:NADH-ubiquinone oxidoreductase subunit, mitochondrial n=1 Tax=Neolecta irregularis (strain DAH-3) TaxID=1198029 RepID=A0A1U7LIA2_NEOID|nr:NADH-ubiquinone oxidoreductase subunit, mitochondrial [Neolecta irregularis DAH-3]|eukprot:OLL22390.1 NADH-ubiquinone oxidoreductase subunit, mitochondrial [Neolecta irregularis DAH-3]